MMIEVKMSELGFENIPEATEAETYESIHEQIEDAPNIADAVLDELKDREDPEPVYKDTYDNVLQDWIEDQVCLLHQKPHY